MSFDEDKLSGIRFRLLGPVTASTATGRRLPINAPKQLAVLAVLLLHTNQVVPEDQLCEWVWGQQPSRSVSGRLHVIITELRSALGQKAVARVGEGYLMSVGPGELDVQVFSEAVAEARAELAAGRGEIAVRRLRSALALWSGPPLGGVSDALPEQRMRLEDQRLSALEEFFEANLATGRHAEAVDELREAVASHPFRERLTTQLMLALARSGRRSEALGVYAETSDRLVDELGIEPGRGLREMRLRVLNNQVDAPNARNPASGTGTGWVAPAELPRDLHGFAGREAPLAALDALLASPEGGVCVISGAAGVGKTALAVHWAHRVRDRFPDGQLYLNMRGYEPEEEPTDAAAALSQLLRSLGMASRLPTSVDELATLYRSVLADRQVLVLLDNVRDAGQVLPLLPPTGSLLVTSRHRLTDLMARAGAAALPLAMLTDEEAQALLAAALGPDRIAAEADPTTELIRLCGGLPLALRIVAAQITTHTRASIADVVAELTQADRLTALALNDTEPSAVTRAFDATCRTLPPAARRLFWLLGLIPGPNFDTSTAAALAAVPIRDAARHLIALTAAHVIEQHAADRYGLHDLARLYASNQARTVPDRTVAWDRLIEHYLALATAAGEREPNSVLRLPRHSPGSTLTTGTADTFSTAALLDEVPNLSAAAPHAAARGPYPAAWLLTGRLRTCMHRHGYRTELRRIAPAILDAACQHNELDVQALLHYDIGYLSFRTGLWEEWRDSRTPQALHHMNEAIRVANACGWRECEAVTLNSLGWLMAWTGRPNEAIGYSERALALFREIGYTDGEGITLRILGGQHHLLGQPILAEHRYLEAQALSARYQSPLSLAADLVHLGSARLSLGRLPEAKNDLSRARDMFQNIESSEGRALSQSWLARLHWELGDYERAHLEATHGLELAGKTSTKLLEATLLLVLADTEVDMTRYGPAEQHVRRVESLLGQSRYTWHLALAGYVRTRIESRRGKHEEAVARAHRALTLARRDGYRSAELLVLRALTEAYVDWEKSDLAIEAGHQALALSQESGDLNEQRRIHYLLNGR